MCKYDVLGIFQLNFEYYFINIYLLFLVPLGFFYFTYEAHIKPMTPKPDGLRAPGGKTPFRSNM